jgi:hypothetical protein
MVYVQSFGKIPQAACGKTGLLAVKKVGLHRQHKLMPASDVVRLCPLAPVIQGNAPRDVDRDGALDRFSTFYLNNYRNIDDFIFMFSDCL